MSAKKGSCLKKLGMGCGGLIALIVLFGFGVFVNVQLNEPEDADYGTVSIGESLSPNLEKGINLPEGNKPVKPVRLIIDASFADLKVMPGADQGKIKIEGDFDKANFELKTDIKEKEDHYEYKVTFKNKRSLLGMIFASHEGVDIENHLMVRLPPDLLYDFRIRADKGDYSIDLSGLAVKSLDVDASMGELDVYMRQPNRVAMEKMEIKGTMGELGVNDIQNYGFKKGRVAWSMGELRVRNSGLLREDMDLHVKMSMGEARVYVPENAVVDSSAGIFLGEKRVPDKGPDFEGETARIKISGGTTMGEFRVERGASRRTSTEIFVSKIQDEGVEPYLAELRASAKADSENNRVGPRHINGRGYLLLRNNLVTEAIEVFKLNVELYPDYANGYDSLAESYYQAGQRDLAYAYYEKALEMNPNNKRARHYLARLKDNTN